MADVSDDGRNWRGIGISLLVITSICSLILLSILLLSPSKFVVAKQTRKDWISSKTNLSYSFPFSDFGANLSPDDRIELADLLAGIYKPKLFNGSWISGKCSDRLPFVSLQPLLCAPCQPYSKLNNHNKRHRLRLR